MSRPAAKNAETKGSKAANPAKSLSGRTIKTIPTKPTIAAPQRRRPTFSPNSGPARAVRIRGPANVITTASASGR